jgi:hypothetical protein
MKLLEMKPTGGGGLHDPCATLTELLGSDSNTIPVWLSPERFLQPDFNAEEVVLDLRRYVSLHACVLACIFW